jgi:ATP-binding cassette, subfamily C, bacterial
MGYRTLLAGTLIATTGIVEGLGLVLLVPLFRAVGVEGAYGSSSRIAEPLTRLLGLGVQPALEPTLLAFTLVACALAVFTRWQSQVTYALEHEYVARCRERLYRAVVSSRWASIVLRRSSDIAHVLTADLQKAGIAAFQLMSLAAVAVLTVVYLVVAIRLSPVVTTVAFTAALVPVALSWGRLNRTARAGDRVARANVAVHGAAAEHLASAKTTKSYGAEGRNTELFVRLSHEVADANAAMLGEHNDHRAFVQISSAVLLAALVLVAVRGVAMPGADLLVLLVVFGRLVPRLSTLHSGALSLVSLLPSYAVAARLLEDCQTNSETPVGDARVVKFTRTLVLEDVSFTYPTAGTPAVGAVTLRVDAGTTIGLAGPSGGGKTTLADLILGLLEPQSGRVLVDDAPLDASSVGSWRAQIGYVAQDTFLFHDSVRANLIWAKPGATEDEVWSALRTAAAEVFVRALPNGLETVLGDRGVRLSGGERQRLALARAILRRPRLLILDEATSALDSENEQALLTALAALHGRTTVVLITHRLGILKDADIIHVIDEGRLVESGTWTGLRENQGSRLRSLARAQGID